MQRGLAQRGAVLPLVAISLTVLLGFGGLSVDVGFWQYQQRQQQNTADSAAIGGAQALDAAGCPNPTAAQAAAQADAASSGGYASSAVIVKNPPTTGAYAGNNCAVTVTVNGTKPAFFSHLFGVPNMAETTTATAQLVSTNPACIYLLSTTAVSTFSGGNVSAPGCGILINNTATFSGSQTINAQSIGYGGSTPPTINGTTFTGATPAPMLQAPNPCPEIPGCASLASNPPSTSNCQTLTANMNPTISPGCYNNLTVGGCGTVTMLPGTYVINGTSNFANSRFVGTGVTFYVTASGTAPDFSASTSATISPPTTGTYAGVLYYQVPSNTSAPNLSGSSVHFNGLVYAPGATGVNFNGAQGDYTILVLGSANLNSSSGYTFGTPPSGSTLMQNVVLTQ
ncbi:MAG: pilus assembly protein TadG-related protein [Candidatus Cybelea sp.]|jgi:hypothetical protein